jgi:hypothetical protein
LAETVGTAQDDVSRSVTWFVRVFLAAFLLCGLVGIEAWPLTGFRLFSHLRHERTISWERTVVEPDGRELAVTFAGLPDGYRSFVLVVKDFEGSPPASRDAMCRTWLQGLRRVRPEATLMRVYELDQSLLPRSGGRPASGPTRSLLFTCSPSGAVEAGGA